MNQRLVDFIRSLMDERDLSRNALAAKMKIAPATLGNVLNGLTQNPDRKFFVQLSVISGRSVAELEMMAYPDMVFEVKAIPEELRTAFLDYMSLPEDVRNTIAAITRSKQ